MSGTLRITFADWLTAAQVDVATEIIQTFGETVHHDRQLRTLTLMPNPGELDVLREFLAVWETDDAMNWSTE